MRRAHTIVAIYMRGSGIMGFTVDSIVHPTPHDHFDVWISSCSCRTATEHTAVNTEVLLAVHRLLDNLLLCFLGFVRFRLR